MKISSRCEGKFIKFENEAGFVAVFAKLGASIHSLYLHGRPLTINFESDEDFFKDDFAYFGRTVGPLCGRFKNGLYVMDGKEYYLEKNNGNCSLHSGSHSFCYLEFDYEVVEEKDATKIIFTANNPAFEGYPANSKIKVVYTVYENETKIRCDTYVENDADAPIKFTNHTYYALGDCEDVLAHKVYINSHETYAYDEDLAPYKRVKVDKTLDFSTPKQVARDLFDPKIYESKLRGYDHLFCFDEVQTEKPQIIVSSSFCDMELYTDCSAAVVYSYNYPAQYPVADGRRNKKHICLAVEAQDCEIDPGKMVYKAGEVCHRFFIMNFIAK